MRVMGCHYYFMEVRGTQKVTWEAVDVTEMASPQESPRTPEGIHLEKDNQHQAGDGSAPIQGMETRTSSGE